MSKPKLPKVSLPIVCTYRGEETHPGVPGEGGFPPFAEHVYDVTCAVGTAFTAEAKEEVVIRSEIRISGNVDCTQDYLDELARAVIARDLPDLVREGLQARAKRFAPVVTPAVKSADR